MDFQQKRFATRTFFNFGETELRYRVKDNGGELEFSVDYGNIPSNKRTIFEKNLWLRNVGLLWCVIGAIQIALALADSGPLTGSGLWLFIGLGCLGFYKLTLWSATVIDTDAGGISILKDRQHARILGTLEERRKARLLSWYQSADFGDDAERKVQAIEYLFKEEVLTRQEADKQIAMITSERQLSVMPSRSESDARLH